VTPDAAQGDRAIRIDGLRRTVSDLRRSIDFYCGALGFDTAPVAAQAVANSVRLQLGEQHIDLVVSDGRLRPGVATAPDPRFQHAAIVTTDIEAACRRLEPYAPSLISRGGPQRLPAHTGGVSAFKFRDPDGHPIELIQFPSGVGDPRWHAARAGGPTLGIDHFAIVVESVDASTAFFATRLHLRVAGRDVNRGAEQERLDGLDDVVVDVVSLVPQRGPRTPHLELLCYRHPAFAAPPKASAPTAGQPPWPFDPGADEIVCLGEGCLRAGDCAIPLRDPDGHCFLVDT
jgi:catechol 2,3-dioxygenase-like lactoylglutathione lyase family enzyme